MTPEQQRALRFEAALATFYAEQTHRKRLRLRYKSLNHFNVERAIENGRERALHLCEHREADRLAVLAWQGVAASWAEY
jgi:hypothetical protein